ncbi:uncharacterized protein EI97DRAFT_21162 [Westerdykella ornata]|uniref:Uncharacterized protein n=1 Tax=Westerdykella ornata TaxID=318751 RepID=A0A6A6K1A3_WESOR|nr:uncharacterized protein EI97DRAFT_21162 [Westerdykella ornata]KAF2281139.1 hypothetical protein EI97DRAFT_21162 [Westerdykella ornata]
MLPLNMATSNKDIHPKAQLPATTEISSNRISSRTVHRNRVMVIRTDSKVQPVQSAATTLPRTSSCTATRCLPRQPVFLRSAAELRSHGSKRPTRRRSWPDGRTGRWRCGILWRTEDGWARHVGGSRWRVSGPQAGRQGEAEAQVQAQR